MALLKKLVAYLSLVIAFGMGYGEEPFSRWMNHKVFAHKNYISDSAVFKNSINSKKLNFHDSLPFGG